MRIDNPPSEPSMDEILASIRQIISADATKETLSYFPQKTEDVLDLTDFISEDFEKTNIQSLPPADGSMNAFEIQSKESPSQEVLGSSFKDKFEDSLLSQKTLTETSQAFHLLNSVIYKKTSTSEHFKENLGGQTVENLVKEMLKPLLKEWLDANLSSLVRAIIAQQIEKIVIQAGHKNS